MKLDHWRTFAGIGLLVAHRPSRGQPATTIRRVGHLSLASGANAAPAHLYAVFKQGMHDLGWMEGKNVEYRFAYADGDVSRLAALGSELIEQNVAVTVVGNAAATHRHPLAGSTLSAGLCATVNSNDPAHFGGYINRHAGYRGRCERR